MGQLRIGDTVCLYSEDVRGYVYATSSSHVERHIAVWPDQERETPKAPDIQVLSFEICAVNRYKLTKQYRKLQEKENKLLQAGSELGPDLQGKLTRNKLSFEAETKDNETEQKKRQGEGLLYGQIVQLRHVFTKKYIHVSTIQMSSTENNSMLVELLPRNAKQAMFKIQPRYKVRAEGDVVLDGDQIVLESLKTSGQALHVSKVHFPSSSCYNGSFELNLSMERSVFTMTRRYKPTTQKDTYLKAGAPMRFFHKVIDAYLCAEGVPNGHIDKDVHFRVRKVDFDKPKTVFPSTSGIVYWQVEFQSDPLSGETLKWREQCVIRHMITQQYLCVTPDHKLTLTPDRDNPNTVFKLHPVSEGSEDIQENEYCRIEHVVTETWVHALKDQYAPKLPMLPKSEKQTKSITWSTSTLRQADLWQSMQFADAFTLQVVEDEDVYNFNFAMGMVPFLSKNVKQAENHQAFSLKEIHYFAQCCTELKNFMTVKGLPEKRRQKLLRNVQLVELLIQVLKLPENSLNLSLTSIKVEIYEVLRTYLEGASRKNELYLARYNDFFFNQLQDQGLVGNSAAQMMVELIRDNRKVVDDIRKDQIKGFVHLLRKNKNPQFLDLLGVLCVCEGVSIHQNQIYITKKWLSTDSKGDHKVKLKSPRLMNRFLFHTATGQEIGLDNNSIYVSSNNKLNWSLLTDFVNEELPGSGSPNQIQFLNKQMDLFGKLCYGGNAYPIQVITEELGYMTWQEAYLCLTNEALPDALRANYCHLIIGLFVDVDENHSIEENKKCCFEYHEVGKEKMPIMDKTPRQKANKVLQLQEWISMFLSKNQRMVSAETGYNQLIEQVLLLVYHLAKRGFYGDIDSMSKLLIPLFSLLDGRNDIPYKPRKGSYVNADVLDTFHTRDRYKPSIETQAIVNAKIQALEVLELFFNLHFNTRMEAFVNEFKTIKHSGLIDTQGPNALLDTDYTLGMNPGCDHDALETLKNVMEHFTNTDDFPIEDIILDLSSYAYEIMVVKSITLLNYTYTAYESLFRRAVQAQLLITGKSCEIYKELSSLSPMLHRVSSTILSEEQIARIVNFLDKLFRLCCLDDDMSEVHSINQTIIYNQDILSDLLAILCQDMDQQYLQKHPGMKHVCEHACLVLKALARDNSVVQTRLFDRLDRLLNSRGFEGPIADALVEVFTNNRKTCLKVNLDQIQKMVSLAAKHGRAAPQILQLLKSVIKMKQMDLPVKRNQTSVIKYFTQYRSELAYILDQSVQTRMAIVREDGSSDQYYLIELVDLLATCAEGDNPLIESICQVLLEPDEILDVVSSGDVICQVKRSYLRFLVWVYMRTGAPSDLTSTVLLQDGRVWHMMKNLIEIIKNLCKFARDDSDTTQLVMQLTKCHVGIKNSSNKVYELLSTWNYILDAVFPFLQDFLSMYQSGINIKQDNIVSKMAANLLDLALVSLPLMSCQRDIESMHKTLQTLLPMSNLPEKVLQDLQEKYRMGEPTPNILSASMKDYLEYYKEEIQLNLDFDNFSNNMKRLYGGKNDVKTQTGHISEREYFKLGSDEELPLGKEFQNHLGCFVKESSLPKPPSCQLAGKLLQKLGHRGMALTEAERVVQHRVDIRCLQLLRAAIHNQIVKLPPDGSVHGKYNKQQWHLIEDTQNAICDQEAIAKVLPLMVSSDDDIIREVLAFLAAMLYGGNPYIQESLLEHFMATKEERFFVTIQRRLQISATAIKERKSLVEQFEDKTRDISKKVHKTDLNRGNENQGNHNKFDKLFSDNSSQSSSLIDLEPFQGEHASQDINQGENQDTLKLSEIPTVDWDFTDDGYLALMLKVLAYMCDGQNTAMQDYVCKQSDNFKSVNLVAEVTDFLDHLYGSIDGSNIEVTSQLFQTLVEFTSGNQTNQQTVLENKVCDYISLILYEVQFPGCSQTQVLQLKQTIGNLVRILTEESQEKQKDTGALSPTNIPEIVLQSIEPSTVYRVAEDCFNIIHSKPQPSTYMKSLAHTVGFSYFHIIRRMIDLQQDDRHLSLLLNSIQDSQCWNYYDNTTLSVEILKDNQLHWIYFPAQDQAALTDGAKQEFNYSVDRSDSECLLDYMSWVPDLMESIKYKRQIHRRIVTRTLASIWWPANMLMMFLSFLAFLLQMVTWIGAADGSSPVPEYRYSWSPTVMLAICVIHNIVTVCVFISFLIIYHPTLPKWADTKASLRRGLNYLVIEEPDQKEKKRRVHLETQFFSFKTFWYMTLMLASFLGTGFYGYFLSLHLLHLAEFVQLIKRALHAVTKNGSALCLIYLFGLVFLFIYALFTFAFYRELMDADAGLYCTNMFECFITTNHHGFVVGPYEAFEPPANKTFSWIGWKAVYDVSFFVIITTIGLNIIFGIIVDTFAELRDLQWKVDNEMKSNCFICQRECHEFESKPGGFEDHVKREHNQWAYVFFFLHLSEIQENNYSALELYVSRKLEKQEYDFFPVNRALSLEHEDDWHEKRLQILEENIGALVQKVQELEAEREREIALKRQRKWEKKHKRSNKKQKKTGTNSSRTDDIDGATPTDEPNLTSRPLALPPLQHPFPQNTSFDDH